MVNKPELLAPAGDLNRLHYALAYGADAVYAGQPAFSLRARENGFRSLDDIAKGIAICREQGKKFYLTSNVIARNGKVEAFCKTLLEAASLGPDALIVADPGIVGFLRRELPETEIHLSVQANTTNWLTASFWADLGIKRIILSRELSLKEVLEIQEKLPDLELEVFVHGNICMSMSGRCMLSNWVSHRDANQGICNNSCRMPYRLFANQDVQSDGHRDHVGDFFLSRPDKPELAPIALDEDRWGTYFMSSRDLCALEILPELVLAGIASFKIEGRTRSVYYLSQVVSAYRQAIDSIALGNGVPPESLDAISLTDSRGRMPGFGFGDKLPQNYQSTQVKSKFGCVAGRISGKEGEAFLVEVKNAFSPSDSLEWMTPKGMKPCVVRAIENFRGEKTDRLHPGTVGKIYLEENPGDDWEYAFLVLRQAPGSEF